MQVDYIKYPYNWKTEIVPSVLKRAGELRDGNKIITEAKCEFCGVENHIYREGSKIVLTVAHLDHDAENHEVSLERLKALCQKCHNNYDMPNRVKNRKKTWEKKKANQWGQISPLFEPKNAETLYL